MIGPGGKNIRALQEETRATIDVQEDGTVYIAAADGVGGKIAYENVAALGERTVLEGWTAKEAREKDQRNSGGGRPGGDRGRGGDRRGGDRGGRDRR